MSGVKKISVSLPDAIFQDLEKLAEHQGRPVANLASFFIELGLHITKEREEFPTEKHEDKQK